MYDKDIGKEFAIKNISHRWVYYGKEKNHNNDYGLSSKDYPFRYYFYRTDNHSYSHKVNDLNDVIKLEDNKTNKMKITNLVKKILDKDTRTLVSAGFINGDLALTDEGVSELLGILFLQNKDELVKIAQETLEDKKTQD